MTFETMRQAMGSVHTGPALRNRIPVLLALKRHLDPAGDGAGLAGHGLDLSGGTGAHLEVMAPGFPTLQWRATEFLGESPGRPTPLEVIDAFTAGVHANVEPALPLDLSEPFGSWHPALRALEGRVRLALSCNVVHITPWAVAEGLFRGAGRLLSEGGVLALYGPFSEGGVFSSDGNRRFDAMLRGQDPSWGIRDLDEVRELARGCGLGLEARFAMPANNLLVVFGREGAG